MTLFNNLQKLWLAIDQLPSNLKSVIIMILFIIISFLGARYSSDLSVKNFISVTKENKQKAEEYTRHNAPLINNELTMIMKSDENITNVMWISYHNSTESLNGLSYLYLTAISEVQQDISYKNTWKDMDYVYYSEEIGRIHSRGFLMVNDLKLMTSNFPRLKKRLELCDVTNAAFFPIEGVKKPIGMIVIFYKNPKFYTMESFQTTIVPHINKLSILLDYESNVE